MTRSKHVFRILFGVIFIAAGTLHFLRPEIYLGIMPPFLPAPLFLVYVSGVLEVLGGVGLLIPRTVRPAAWGLAGLLVAFLSVHVYMLIDPAAVGVAEVPPALLWGRLALQFVLVWWLLAAGSLFSKQRGRTTR